MKKLFLFLLIWGICLEAGFAPGTLVVTGGDFFKQIKYINFSDYVNCFDFYYQNNSFQISSLSSCESPVGIYLCFGKTELVCDPQQLFRLYNGYGWIRACDVKIGCLLLDMDLRPVRVTNARLLERTFVFYKFNVPLIGYHNFFVTDLCINAGNY